MCNLQKTHPAEAFFTGGFCCNGNYRLRPVRVALPRPCLTVCVHVAFTRPRTHWKLNLWKKEADERETVPENLKPGAGEHIFYSSMYLRMQRAGALLYFAP